MESFLTWCLFYGIEFLAAYLLLGGLLEKWYIGTSFSSEESKPMTRLKKLVGRRLPQRTVQVVRRVVMPHRQPRGGRPYNSGDPRAG